VTQKPEEKVHERRDTPVFTHKGGSPVVGVHEGRLATGERKMVGL